MREASPAGLLTLIAVSALFLLLTLLAVERTRSGRADPEARRALREAAEALRALPEGSPLLVVPEGLKSASFARDLPGTSSAYAAEWTVQALRWEAAGGAFVPVPGGERRDLARVTLRVRPRRAAPELPAPLSLSRTLYLARPLPGP